MCDRFQAVNSKGRFSIAGGEQPRWRGDGNELFFVGGDGKMMAVAVKTGAPSGPGAKPSFEPGTPQPLFQTRLAPNNVQFEYDVTADGRRFLLDTIASSNGAGGSVSGAPLTVVVNWDAGLKK